MENYSSEIPVQISKITWQAAVRVGFSCPDFSPAYICESDLLVLHSLLIQKKERDMFQSKAAHFKGKSEISLIDHPLERPVFPS